MSKLIRDLFLALVLCAGLSMAALAQPQGPQLRGFPTPEAAADALTEAIRNNDDKAMTAILGSTWHEFAPGGDQDDDEIRATFLKAWDEKHTIIPEGPDKALFGAGTTGWVAPIPIVKQGNEWRFDVEAGKKEMQARLIGRNELAVVQTLLAIVDAQRDYAALDPMKVGASGLCTATAEQSRPQGRALLGEQAGRAGQPARSAGRQGAARRVRAVRLLRLSLSSALQPGSGCAGRRLRLPGQWPHAGRLRRHRLAGELGRDRRDDLHRQPQQRRLREGSRPRHGAGGGGDQRLQSRQVVGQGRHDARKVRANGACHYSSGLKRRSVFSIRRSLKGRVAQPDGSSCLD